MRIHQARTTLAVIVVIALAGVFYMLKSRASPPEPKVMNRVSIDLPGDPSHVKGMTVLVSDNGRGSSNLLEPQQLTIHTPDGWSMTVIGRSSTVSVRDGVVRTVYVRRPLEPVRFLQAKADMLDTLSHLGIEPDPSMQNQISSWIQDAPGNGEISGLMPYDWKTGINSQFHGLVLSVRLSADPNHGWYYLLIFSSIEPDSIPAISPATQPTTQPAGAEPFVSISAKVMGAPADVHGAEADVPTKGMGEADFLRPQSLTLTLPDKQRIQLTARSSNVMFFDGIAHGVYVRRPMKSVPFKEAMEDLIRTLTDLHIELDDSAKTMMALWPEDAENERRPLPGLEDYQAGFSKPIHGATLTLRLCPDPKGGWYYLLIFSVGSVGK